MTISDWCGQTLEPPRGWGPIQDIELLAERSLYSYVVPVPHVTSYRAWRDGRPFCIECGASGAALQLPCRFQHVLPPLCLIAHRRFALAAPGWFA